MGDLVPPLLQGELLDVRLIAKEAAAGPRSGQVFRLEVCDEAASSALLAALPLLDRLLGEKLSAERERRLEEMIDFFAARMLAPSPVDVEMAQRLGARHARILDEFGFLSAAQLADLNGSTASNRAALADNWRKRGQVFAVPHPDRTIRERDVYPAFQFENGKPRKIIKDVLDAFGGRRPPWKVALWFTSANGLLPGSARPVDLLAEAPDAVSVAARRDAEGAAA